MTISLQRVIFKTISLRWVTSMIF